MDLHTAGRLLTDGEPQVSGCVLAGAYDHSTPDKALLSRLFRILETSPLARTVLHRAAGRGVHVCLDAQTELLAYYFASLRIIGVSSDLSEAGMIVFLAHELAHVPQHPVYSDSRYFPPRHLLLLRRVREAAAEALATRIAWQLRERGYADAWNEKASGPYGDLAQVFEGIIGTQSDRQVGPKAARAAFDGWFQPAWRRDVYDHMTLSHLQRIAADELGLVPPRRMLTHDFLTGIARLNGEDFLSLAGPRHFTDPYYSGGVSTEVTRGLSEIHSLIERPFESPMESLLDAILA
jgi:hypothetical protein